MYRIKSFFTRLLRAFNWGVFIFKQPKWQEYTSFVEIMEKRLLSMASYFEKMDITVSAQHNAKRMRLAAKLLKMYREGYYQNKYSNEHWVYDVIWAPFFVGSLREKEWYGGYDSTHNIQGITQAEKRDEKALRIAMLIIGKDLPRWWM